ncbi:ribbon-helix-helix domain-containing protein [Limibacillus halophilus]|uniref:Putative DNA-binding ribbon-helix-helix protein n=1 Tax=Limibacillus halophilus TaxID=1579333 RepID=A0A839SVW2_9PROT|nr:ribbon-helix-helix domain-containing protein [Limibacillus halophilus]MBB3066937.1 putative DNA-binding ribbon-helix-helix protein [Limibacillus halophilus]
MPQALRKRSVTIAGHRTSFSLEDAFWQELKDWASEEDCSLNELVAQIDGARIDDNTDEGRGVNLSSALRLAILARLRERLDRATSS